MAVTALLPEWRTKPWRNVLTDTESTTGVAVCETHAGRPIEACDNCGHIETYSESLAAFIALLGPPVALALAEMLEHQADDMSDEHAETLTFSKADGGTYSAVCDNYGGQRWDWTAAVAVARAVLREPEGGDRT
jgi:hypothetical protein